MRRLLLLFQGKLVALVSPFMEKSKIIMAHPDPNMAMKAFDRNMGTEDAVLGQAITDGQGNYSISYTPGQLRVN